MTTAAALGLVVGMLGAGPAAASASGSGHPGQRGPHAGPEFGLTLAHAPSALRAAVRRALGAPAAPARRALRADGDSPQAELGDPGATPGDDFARSVAISGSTAVVASELTNSQTGAAYVFTRAGAAWSLETELTANDGAPGDYFGAAVAISAGTVVVGAPGNNDLAGGVYVFTGSGSTWSEQAELTDPAGTETDDFGGAVAISGDTLAVGAIGANSSTGAAYVFSGSGATWSQPTELTASDSAPDGDFGGSVGVSGSTVVVNAQVTTSGNGAAYVYAWSGSTWYQQAELTDPADDEYDQFGWSVAISGSTVVVGAPGDSADTGAAYVFTRSGSTWSQTAELTASDSAPDHEFGWSVAISGTTVLVGALGSSYSGAAYTFARSGPGWIQEAELTADDLEPDDYYGYSVAISGTTAVVGAPQQNSHAGVAYVYALPSVPQQLTVIGAAAADHFGYSVAISGSTAVVGAYGIHSGTGAAYVFVRSHGFWIEQAELTAADGTAGDDFGWSVAISGSTVVVGAPHHGSSAGAAYVFTWSDSEWSQQAELTAAGSAVFGGSVALSGGTAIVGADGTSGSGAAYVFTRSGSAWSQRVELTDPGAASGDDFGYSVAVSASAAVVSAPGSSSGTGAAYVFARASGRWPRQATLTAADAGTGDYFGWSVAISGTTAVVGADGNDLFTGAAYVFARSGTSWPQQAELTDPGGTQYDYFGSSVAVSGATVMVGAYGSNAGTGAAYTFRRSGTAWSQQADLPAGKAGVHISFGWSVAVSGAIGVATALGRNPHTRTTGTAFVFGKV